jgi:uncharacterized protein YbbC (DUF1343 family)
MNPLTSLWISALVLTTGCRLAPVKITVERLQKVRPGVEVLLDKRLDLVRGKRVGLIANPTAVDSRLISTADRLRRHPAIELVALYGPEHGVRGNAQAGEYIPFHWDKKLQLPVFSLYGQSRKPEPGMLTNIDEYMRSFDTNEEDKAPKGEMLESVDVMVFDLQDVGTRVYTYVATMAYAMQACAESEIPFVVLDRPNPINGVSMEGPILEYPEHSSFIGLYPIPLRHGMTAGELARLFNERFLQRRVDLTVVPMEGWHRSQWFDATSLPWVIPSPNMPSLDTATVYPGQVLLEGTNVSEGRGTTRPFEQFGAPWIDGYELTQELNRLGLPGVRFREAWFTPTFSKYKGERCGGCQLHVTNRRRYRPVATSLHIIKVLENRYPDQFRFHADYFDKLTGTSEVRTDLERAVDVKDIVRRLKPDLKRFAKLRRPYLLYR